MKKLQIQLVLILSLFSAMFTHNLQAQSTQEFMYEAYLTGSQTLWKQAIKNAPKDSWENVQAYYGLLSSTMATQNEALFDQYLDATLEALDQLEKQKDHQPKALAIRAGVYGLIMAYSPWKSMVYGIKSSNNLEEAFELAPKDPVVLASRANSLFYTPESFGGDRMQAATLYRESIAQFEKQQDHKAEWLYLQTLANAGQVFDAINQKEEAVAVYNKALTIAPNFYYVSKVLLPKAQGK